MKLFRFRGSKLGRALVITTLLFAGLACTLMGCLKSYYNISTRPEFTIERDRVQIRFAGYLTCADPEAPGKNIRVEGHIPADSSTVYWDFGWFLHPTSDGWFDSLIFVVDTTMIIPVTSRDTFLCAIPDTVAGGESWPCKPPTLKELHAEEMRVRMVVQDIRLDGSRPPRRFVLDFVVKRWTQHITILSGK